MVTLFMLMGCAGGGPDQGGHSWIRAPFRVQPGDDARFAATDFDDSSWTTAGSALAPGSKLEGWNGVAWFRMWLEITPEQAGRPLPLYGRYAGATEVFIDGARAYSIGEPSEVARTGSTPVDFSAVTPQLLYFERPGRHLFAVRFASQHVAALHRIGFPGGFELALDARPSGRAGAFANATFFGATLALALLHLLLFAFHRNRRENLHYALTALAVGSIAVLNEWLRLSSTATEAIAVVGVTSSAIILSTLWLLRFYHSVFSAEVPRSYSVLLVLGLGLAAASWTLPRAFAYGFAGVAAVAQLRVLVSAVLQRLSGAWIIGLGGTLWLLGASLQMLGDVGVIPALGGTPYLSGFLALLVSMSVYLARDIARDKDELRDTLERYRTLFQTTGTATILFGEDGLIALANDEWVKLTGYSREEIEGRMTWRPFFSDASLEKAAETQLKDRRGKLHDGVVTISQIPGTTERVASFLDLTELKRAQRQMFRADKMAALGQISAGVAHEINNPNNFIHFNLPVLRRYVEAMRPILQLQVEKEPDLQLLGMKLEAFIEDLFKLIDNMEHGSTRISAIVSNLKSYIRSGEDLEMTRGSIKPVVDRALALVGGQVSKLVKRLEVEVPEGLPPIKMNAGKLEQVVINLLINASQAADKPDSWVKLSARADDSALEVVVEDNGAGIPKELLEQIFEPFFTTKGRETGTGLGLSVSQQIVEEHGGRLEVTSDQGSGACFKVRLPL